MRISYRQKIFISMTATLTFLIVTLILLAEIGMRDFSRRDQMNHAELVAKTFSETSLPFFIYYDWEELKRLSRNISYQDLISFIILDKENVVRVSTKLESWVGRKYNISPLPLPPDKTSMSEQYFLFSEKQKIRVVDVYVPVKVENSSKSWGTIVLTFSLEKIKKGLARMRFVLIISGICLILSLSFLNRKIAEYIAKPVKTLSEHVDEISKGNYDKKITPMGMDEFEELIISINLMAENLSKRERELREAKDFLEEKVKERTEELRKSEEKFRDFFERAVEAILIIDIKEMKVEKANEMAEKLFRFPDRIEGKQISLLDNEKEELKALLEETIKNGTSYSSRLELKKYDSLIV
ncbi:MAG: HAMP domain-containing protein, partial [Candidatus Aminicenantia bacterium]